MTLKILIAEDSETNRLLFSMTMRRLAYEADIVANGAEALKHFMRRDYDLVFLDLNMPVMDGVETARQMRQYNKRNTPVYAVSGFLDEGKEAQFGEAGIRRCLIKPLDRGALSGVLSECGLRAPVPEIGTADFLPPASVPQRLLKVYARELCARGAVCEKLGAEHARSALLREAHTVRALGQMLDIKGLEMMAAKLYDMCHGPQEPEAVRAQADIVGTACKAAAEAIEKHIEKAPASSSG